MYINAVVNTDMLYLQYDFYNITFKITYKLYITSRPPPLPKKKFWVRTGIEAIPSELLQNVMAFLPGGMQDCRGGNGGCGGNMTGGIFRS
jgi:hypothetical protein